MNGESRRRKPLLRTIVESVVAFAISFAAVALVLVLIRGSDDDGAADVADGAISVDEVIALGGEGGDVVLTGFVFVGEERSILCSARTDDDPPFCDGNAIDLDGLDTSRLDLVVPEGAPAYSRDEVTLAGRYRLTTLAVREILQS